MTIIIGIDPGSRITGYGVISQIGCQLNYLVSGCINSNSTNMSSRLKLIYIGVHDIITKYSPDYFAIEQVFMDKNVDSALKLAQASGAAIIAAVNNHIPVFEYAARQVKKTVTGIGSADKRQIQHMVCNLLHLRINLKVDAADALAIAITHSHVSQNTAYINNNKSVLKRGRLKLK